MNIRLATKTDLAAIMPIFDKARAFMAANGNNKQWINGYPQQELIEKEIKSGHCYVCTDETQKVVATFCFIKGPDPTYALIEEGSWPNDKPYYVIHRLASDGSHKGIARLCINWCFAQHPCLRADTHEDNHIMQHLLEQNGFVRCGIIYVANGTPRIAYQKDK